jgi:hypothetical protein
VKKRISLENDNSRKEEENDKLENQLKDDKFTLAESERKYEDIARKLATKVGRIHAVQGNSLLNTPVQIQYIQYKAAL